VGGVVGRAGLVIRPSKIVSGRITHDGGTETFMVINDRGAGLRYEGVNMQQTIEPTELTPKQAAEMLGVTERTLYDWRARGEGPAWSRTIRGIGRIRYTVQAIREHRERMTQGR